MLHSNLFEHRSVFGGADVAIFKCDASTVPDVVEPGTGVV